MLPLIATRNTAAEQDAITTGRPLLGSTGVSPTVYGNEGVTAEDAPYLLKLAMTGQVTPYEFAAAIAQSSNLNELTVRMIINSTYEVIENYVRQFGAVRIETPLGVIQTEIAGSVENATDELDPEVNYAYLNFIPCRELQKATDGLAYFNATEKFTPYDVDTVRDAATGKEEPFRCGSDVTVRGSNFDAANALSASIVDETTGEATPVTVKSIISEATLVVTIPTTINAEHKHKIYVRQTIDGVEWNLPSNKAFAVLPAPQPDHEILLVKHGDRDDNKIAFEESQPVVCTVAHHNGAGYELRAEKPVKIVLDYENQRHVYAVLDTQTIVNVNETTVSFMNDENDTEEVDGSFWNHDVELTLYFADGGSATKTVRFVQL